MKKLAIIILLLTATIYPAQAQTEVVKNRDGNFVSLKTPRVKYQPQLTSIFYVDSKGVNHQVYVTDSGRYFYIRTSAKTQKEYRVYLKEVQQ